MLWELCFVYCCFLNGTFCLWILQSVEAKNVFLWVLMWFLRWWVKQISCPIDEIFGFVEVCDLSPCLEVLKSAWHYAKLLWYILSICTLTFKFMLLSMNVKSHWLVKRCYSWSAKDLSVVCWVELAGCEFVLDFLRCSVSGTLS